MESNTNKQKLKESEEKYRLILESISDPLYVVDAELKIIYINPAFIEWLKVLGLNYEIIGKTPAEAFPFVGEKATKEYQEIFNSKKEHFLDESTVFNNKRIFTETKKIPILKSEKVIQIVTIVRDVTERKEIELKLKESEEKFRYFFDNTQVGLFWSRISDGKIIECNITFAKLVGYDTREDCLADYIALEHYVDLNTRNEMLEKLRINNEIKDFKIQATKRDGTPFWANISARIDLKENRIEGAAIDITVRKKAEKDLQLELDNLINILNSMEDGVYIVDKNYEIVYVNPILTQEFGQYEGKKCHKYFHDRNELCPWCKNQEVFEGKTVMWEWTSPKNQNTYDRIDTPLKNPDGSLSKLGIFRDITMHKKKEEELKESEKKYRELLENMMEGYYALDLKGNFTFVNDYYCKVLGYSKEEIIGKNYSLIFDEKTSKKLFKMFNQLYKSGIPFPHTTRAEGVTNRGKQVYLEGLIDLIYDSEGNKTGFYGFSRDITEKKKAEQKLMESEVKYRHLFETSPYFIGVIDTKSVLVDCNDVSMEFLSIHTKGDIIGKNITEIFSLNEKNKYLIPIFEKVIKNIFEGAGTNQESFDFQLYRPSGGYLWLHVEGTLTEIEKQKVIQFIIQDITERKEKEEEIRFQSEIIENMSEGVYLIKLDDGTIVYNNPAFEEMFGYNPGEMIGKNVAIVNAPTDTEPEETREIIMEIIKETGEWHGEVLNIKKDGTPFWNYANVSLFDHPDHGRVIVSVHTDITERKKAELEIVNLAKFPSENPNPILRMTREKVIYANKEGEKIFTSSKGSEVPAVLQESLIKALDTNKTISTEITLNSRVFSLDITPISEEGYANVYGRDITERKNAEVQLKSIMEELKRSNVDLEQYAYVASHDLKEPLRMISSFVQLLEKRYKDKLDEDANDFIRFITEGVVRMQDLIRSLLTYSRIGKHDKEFEMVDLNVVLKDVIDNLKQLINETNAEIVYDSLPIINCDKNQLLQVFQNLISNAIKFRGIDSLLINISVKPDGKHWVFSIRDNGIGIDPKDFERIFIIFQRLHEKDEFEGTGIGLAICKKIVEQCGGKIWVESEVGKGSTFFFTIPKSNDKK